MAKKTFSPVEQHVEKAVLGVAALILVVVAALFLVSTPNREEVAGQQRGPNEIGQVLKKEADDLRRRLQTAQFQAESVPDFRENLLAARERGPLGMISGITPELRPVTGFGAEVPDMADIEHQGGKITLAEVIACDPPAARTGKLLGVSVEPAVLTLDAGGRPEMRQPDDALVQQERQLRIAAGQIIAEDMYWVSVATRFDLAAQREAMKQRNYESGRTDIMVTRFQLQRQQRQPDGTWSDWQDVETYQSVVLPQPPELAVGPDDKLPSYQWELVRGYGSVIREYQPTILHPEFEVEFHAGEQPEPPEFPGLKERLAELDASGIDRGSAFASQTVKSAYLSTPDRYGSGGGGGFDPDAEKLKAASGLRDGGRDDRGGARSEGFERAPRFGQTRWDRGEAPQDLAGIRKQFKDAQDAFKKGDLDEAWSLAQQVRGKLPDPLERQLDDLVAQIQEAQQQREVERAKDELARLLERQKAQREGRMAEWLEQQRRKEDFLWAYDLSITPGRTYRYRCRVLLYNLYVGVVSQVADRADAEKIQLVGEWSAPSGPIEVERDTYFYLTSADPRNNEARVSVYKWFLAQWHKQDFRVGVGESIGRPKPVRIIQQDGMPSERPVEVDFQTGAVVVDLDFNRDAMVMESRGPEQFDLRTSTGALAMVYLDADGGLGERLEPLDRVDPTHIRIRDEMRDARPRRPAPSLDTDRRAPPRASDRRPAVDRRPRTPSRGGDIDAAKLGGRRR